MLGWILPLFHFSFWFNPTPPPFSPVFEAMFSYGNLLIMLIGIMAWVIVSKRPLPKDLRRSARAGALWLIWFGIVGWLLYEMNWLRLPILGMRIFFLGWVGVFGAWAWTIIEEIWIKRPRRMQAQAARAAYEKWLPKPKK